LNGATSCLLDSGDVTVGASVDDAKSTLEDAYGIAAPKVVGHYAENLRNTGSVLRATLPP
jgi:hypothetical protein